MTDSPSRRRQALIDHYALEVAARREETDHRSSLYGDALEALPESVRPFTFGCGQILDLVDVAPGETLLDLGCGGGVDLILAARDLGDQVHRVGVDPSPDMARLARENLAAAGLENTEVLETDAFGLTSDSGPFDRVMAHAVLNLIPERVPVLRRLLRLMPPTGRMVVSDPVIRGRLPRQLTEAPSDAGALVLFRDLPIQSDYLDAFFEAGFESVETVSVVSFDPRPAIREAAARSLGLDDGALEELDRALQRVQFHIVTLIATPEVERHPSRVLCCGQALRLEHAPTVHLDHSPSLERKARMGHLNTVLCPFCRRRVATVEPFTVFAETTRRVYHVFPEAARAERDLLLTEIERFHEMWAAQAGKPDHTSHLVFGPAELARAIGPLL